MLLFYLCASLNQILTENVTQRICNTVGKNSSYETSFSNKTKICDFSIFAMSWRVTFFLTCPYFLRAGVIQGSVLNFSLYLFILMEHIQDGVCLV